MIRGLLLLAQTNSSSSNETAPILRVAIIKKEIIIVYPLYRNLEKCQNSILYSSNLSSG
jgi:hypothetical protein